MNSEERKKLEALITYFRVRADENKQRSDKMPECDADHYRGWHQAKYDTYERCAKKLEEILAGL